MMKNFQFSIFNFQRDLPRSKRSFASGFTIIETLIAISILVLAVTGAFSAAHNGMTSALFSKDQITAFYLAQEGIEQIRNLRDRNGLQGVGWMNGIANAGDPCQFSSTCYVDAVNTTHLIACSGTCPNLRINTNGFYSYDSGTESKFRREVVMTEVVTNQEIEVKSTIYWSKGLINRSFTATERLFNWQ